MQPRSTGQEHRCSSLVGPKPDVSVFAYVRYALLRFSPLPVSMHLSIMFCDQVVSTFSMLRVRNVICCLIQSVCTKNSFCNLNALSIVYRCIYQSMTVFVQNAESPWSLHQKTLSRHQGCRGLKKRINNQPRFLLSEEHVTGITKLPHVKVKKHLAGTSSRIHLRLQTRSRRLASSREYEQG